MKFSCPFALQPLAAILVCAVLSVLPGWSQEDSAKDSKAEDEEFDPTEPGPEHQWLAQFVGDWTAEVTIWLGDEVMEKTKGKASFVSMFDGRYVEEEFSCVTKAAGVLSGKGFWAYDRLRGEFIHTWIDNLGTSVSISHGNPISASELETFADEIDPRTGKEIILRSLLRLVNRNHFVVETSSITEDGTEAKMLEVSYQRLPEDPTESKADE